MIREVKESEKKEFNKSVTHPFQSWEWGEFRKASGNDILRLAQFKDGKLADPMQITLHSLPLVRGLKIATLIKGPQANSQIIQTLRSVAKENNLIFVKIQPNHPLGDKNGDKEKQKYAQFMRQSGAVAGKWLFNPTTFLIDLTPSEETIMAGFTSKTRYNIRVAQRSGVEVKEDNSDAAFEKYLNLTRETVERQGYYAHAEAYHRLMWKTLHTDLLNSKKAPIARLFVALYKGQIITAWILIAWHQFLYYPFGASTVKFRNVMANNLMMWEAIRFGKSLGLKGFDLWGRDPGKGFTKFKEGFNPKVVEFLPTYDLITSPFYYPYLLSDKARWAFLHARTKIGLVKPQF